MVEDVYQTLISPNREQQCFDEHNWNYIASNGTVVTCDKFRKSDGSLDTELCLTVGHFSSDRAINASDACWLVYHYSYWPQYIYVSFFSP